MTAPSKKRTGEQCVSVSLPELLQLANNAKQLSLSALNLGRSTNGPFHSRLLGRGMEFAESRLYQAGDDIRSIDWRVTARTGKTHTKLYTLEKERQVLVWVDMRSPMFFATQGVFKSVQAATLAAYIGWNTVQTGNRLGGMIFDDTNHLEFRPKLGKRGILPFLQGLTDKSRFNPKEKPVTSSFTIDRAVSSIEQVATPGSLVFIISDFRRLSSQAIDRLNQLSRTCELCLCFLYDPLEAALPKNGHYPVTDGTGKIHLDTFNRTSLEQYQRQFLDRKNSIQSLAQQRHIYFMECSTQDDCLTRLMQITRRGYKNES
jgi:uncharacterized protein (DUF58 family)